MIKKIVMVTTMLVVLTVFSLGNQELIVFHAGSLTEPIRKVEKAFNKKYGGGIFFRDEPAGSVRAIKFVTELGKRADVIAVADYSLIPQFLIPNHANWYIQFAKNELVIAFTKNSRYSKEINAQNWFEILQQPGVEFGFSNPNLDPAGYRTRLMFELAGIYYDKPDLANKLVSICPMSNIKPMSVELISALQAGEIDYAFEYLSVAKENGLKYIELPAKINFSDQKYASFYSKASLTLNNGKQVVGKPIVYGITILNDAPHKKLAEKFLQFMFSDKGREILEKNELPSVALRSNIPIKNLPEKLRGAFQKENAKK